MSELISVIVPVYNVEKYLEKCVCSIVNQTYKNLEIILIDDGSTDNSGKLCDKMSLLDSRITVIHKQNGGLSDARNAGISIAKGSYFSFVDSDDYILDDTLEKMYYSAINNKCEISICNMIRFFDDDSFVPFYVPTTSEQVLSGDDRFETLSQPSVCNKLFKASLFDNVRFPVGKYYEDTFVYHALVYKAKSVSFTGQDGYWYLSRKESILGQENYTDRYFDFVEAVYLRASFLIENQIQKYALEACLSQYAAYSNAIKKIKRVKINNIKFYNAKNQYIYIYNYLIKNRDKISIKQLIRLFILRYFPDLHKLIY